MLEKIQKLVLARERLIHYHTIVFNGEVHVLYICKRILSLSACMHGHQIGIPCRGY